MADIKAKKLDLSKLKDLLNKDIKSLKPKKVKMKKPSKTYIGKKVIAFDIGSSSIKVVIGKKGKNKMTIYDAFVIPIPDGLVVDGNLFNSMDLTRIIKNELNSRNIKIKDVVYTSNSTTIINRELILPVVEEKELDTLVNFEIQQYLPINLSDYIVQYNIIEEIVQEDLPKYKVLVVTYPHKIAKEYFKLSKSCELKPNSLDITFNSINKLVNNFNVVNGEEINKEETLAFIDMGNESLNIHIYNQGNLDFTRTVRSGGGELDGAIAREFSVTLNEAKDRKIKYTTLINRDITSSEQEEFNKNLRPYLDEWSEEMQRIVQFYKNKNVGNKIHKIFIYGGTSRIKGMDKYLQEKFNIPVFNIENIEGIECSNNEILENLDLYLNALGSIIRL